MLRYLVSPSTLISMDKQSVAPISPQQAEQAINAHFPCLSSELRPLSHCIGRTLRENIHAERDNPPFDRVCMDGIAVRSGALGRGVRQFTVTATQAAGSPALAVEDEAHAVEVMTGAILPQSADCVVPLEQYSLIDGIASLQSEVDGKPYRNVQRRGEDGERGLLMLKAGTLLGPPEIAVAASAGVPHLRISSQPAFMVISTGDELVEPGEPIEHYQVRRSNAYGMQALLRTRGFERVGNDHVMDDMQALRERLTLHLATHEVVILSGGVSMGRFDLVPKVLAELGVREVFHRVTQRPGRPMWFGVGPQGQAVFGLPGNPVSTLVCLVRYVLPAVYAAMGTATELGEEMALYAPVEVNVPLTCFMPVTVELDEWGRPWANAHATNTSGDFLSLAETSGFIELPPGPASYPRGFVGKLYRW